MVKGVGWVEWLTKDANGQVAVIKTRSYYVPDADIRLMSPQSYFQIHENGSCTFDSEKMKLTTADGIGLEFPYEMNSNLPFLFLDPEAPMAGLPGSLNLTLQHALTNSVQLKNVLLDENYNMTTWEKELSLIHQRLGHASATWLQSLMTKSKAEVGATNSPIIKTKYKRTAKCPVPCCMACKIAKQFQRPTGLQTTINLDSKRHAIRKHAMQPGDEVSVDQYVCRLPGRLPHTKGKESPTDRYHGGTLFYDNYSGYIHLHNQVSLRIGETLVGKRALDRFASQFGVKIKKFRCDNHPFNSQEFLEDLAVNEQTVTYCGVGAHHQNGVAERAIKSVTLYARAMMLHQLLHWPEAYDESLWPFALEHAVYIWNNLPRQDSLLTPTELFTGMKLPDNAPLDSARVWGCPTFVLDPRLQAKGGKIKRWKPRSRVGVNLGHSPMHHHSVHCILNLKTGYISPQFHLVFDELFQSVFGDISPERLDQAQWESILELGHEQHLDPTDRSNPEVTQIANDLYSDYIDDDDDDYSTDLDSDSDNDNESTSTSASEGDDSIKFPTMHLPPDEPSVPEGVTT